MTRDDILTLAARVALSSGGPPADPRIKAITDKIVADLFLLIDEFDVSAEEFWAAIDWLNLAGRNHEWGLIAPGLGLEHFLDLRMDAADAAAGIAGGTPRTIEGPLYVSGAPVVTGGVARLDDGSEPEAELTFVEGQVRDLNGQPLAGAVVEVWHANGKGGYSHFDTTQSAFNLRRTVVTDGDARFTLQTIMPSGYAVPPGGATDRLMTALGRHGRRPAHIHFLVRADGHRPLTTQINIGEDPFVHDDFAFGTRDGLICEVERFTDPAALEARGIDRPFALIRFDFALAPAASTSMVHRSRMSA